MIQTTCVPKGKEITLPIPETYIGAKLEILIYPVEETSSAAASSRSPEQKKPVFGCARGQFKMAPDFDAPLDDFKDYMQ